MHKYPQLYFCGGAHFALTSTLHRMKRLLIALIALLLVVPTNASAQPCSLKACVDVYASENQIIIEARKGSGSAKKKVTPIAKPKPKPTPTLWFPPRPTPKPRVHRHPIAVAKKTVQKQVISTSASLSDRLIKLLPTAGVAYQPQVEPLINVPIYFWCDLPQIFQTRVDIIGEVVDVALRPGFLWSFGDGSFYSTTDSGAPYPNGRITHTYKRPGTYLVTLLATWSGTFTHNGVVRAITGQVKKTSVATVTVVSASTKFVN